MKYIIKTESLENLPDTRPLIAMDSDGALKWLIDNGSATKMIDLGLESGTLWAAYNLGATPGDTASSYYGNYFMWADPEPANTKTCTWKNYKYSNGAYNKLTKYCPADKTSYWDGGGTPDKLTTLVDIDDPATVILGPQYYSPSTNQINELKALNNEWVTNYDGISGLNGRVFTGTNGNTLFIPAAGRRGSSFEATGTGAYLWSSALYTFTPYDSYYLTFNSTKINLEHYYRYYACSVRAVRNAYKSN